MYEILTIRFSACYSTTYVLFPLFFSLRFYPFLLEIVARIVGSEFLVSEMECRNV